MKLSNRKNIRTPQKAISYAMSVLKAPYSKKDKELKIISQDPIVCLFYIKYVLMSGFSIPGVILSSVVNNADAYVVFQSMFPFTQKIYDSVKKIIKRTQKK